MGARQPTTPKEAPARASTVVGFYTALLLGGFFWHAISQDTNDIWRLEPSQGWLALLLTPLWGVGFGLVTVQVFRALELRMRWLSELHGEFQGMFGRPQPRELFLLAGASALGEEILFRGAMMDAWGLWMSSAVFALLHIPRRRALWPWTMSSFVLGLALGLMTELTGNLGAAVAAHFTINLLNMAYITRNRPRVHVDRVQPPSG